MDNVKLEETAAELLGQIQASVAECVRSLNEAGALRRREADEAHRQHDQALQSLKSLEERSIALHEKHALLLRTIAEGWSVHIKERATEVAIAEAKEYAKATMTTVEERGVRFANQLTALISGTEAVIHRATLVARSLAWRTAAVSIAGGAVILGVLGVAAWAWGRIEIRGAIRQYAHVEVAGAAVNQQASRARLIGCETDGRQRLCIRIDDSVAPGVDSSGVAYAVVYGY